MLAEDYTLSSADVQTLSSADALVALFSKLGFDTNARLPQSASAMGIGNEDMQSSIRRIERIASNDDGISSLQIYLFELKSLTVAATRSLVRAFRDRIGDYLLVLTRDYEQLDFVLVDRYMPEDAIAVQASLPGMPVIRSVRVQPRILSIDRRKPSQVALRTLRRFSYTESDTITQFDKLRTAYDVAYWSEPFFNNRALFSDYYLKERLPQHAEWQHQEEATARTRAFRRLREQYSDHEHLKERVPQVLALLGFAAISARAADSDALEPDYRLYDGSSARDEQTVPLALCLAYPWGRSLDGKDEQRDQERAEHNPSAVVVKLIDSGEAPWAIVTNGKIWRLYSATAHSRATNYYEIDLQDILSQPPSFQAEAFPYFWLLFRAAAFTQAKPQLPGVEYKGSFLDHILDESRRYARTLEEALKQRVFEEVFPHFASGFINFARQHGHLPASWQQLPSEERDGLLAPFFSGTLTFLYRLLFVLYAESRDLLPVRETQSYYTYSLERLKHEVAEQGGIIVDEAPAKIRRAYNETSTELYDRLQLLFRAIEQGDATLNVPVYNGGLFAGHPDDADASPEAEVARFLAKYKVPDRQLALGIDRLSRDVDEKTHDLAFIDYKSLGVRQLGSIYEGLLEFKLRVAPEKMAIVRGKKTEEIVPYAEARHENLKILTDGVGSERKERTIAAGELYIENDKRERKASGSYYTPDYIVKYIVEDTVGPILHEKLEALRSVFRQAQQTLQAERQKRIALQGQGLAYKAPEEETYLKHRTAVNEAFFDLKVLDPAMGSGHFLVEAVDYITDRMADFLTAFPWNPVVYELAKTRNEIQNEMERQGVLVDTGRLTDLNLLKRHVLKRCIYGVDVNPMAVELAKVSLWLDCFTLGAPLSFLDHHIKPGNSLIGTSVEVVQQALASDLWGNQFANLLSATQLMRKVGDLSDATAQEVAASKKAYKGAYDALMPYKRLLNVWLSEYFDNKGAQQTVSIYSDQIVANTLGTINASDREGIELALKIAETRRFFHWDVEFPEVFYDTDKRKRRGGFDTIIGNPPYVNMVESSKQGDEYLKPYLRMAFAAAAGGFDWYVLFQEQALRLARQGGYTGLIIPNKFLSAEYAIELRKWLLKNAQLQQLADFSTIHVFDASVYPVIAIYQRQEDPTTYPISIERGVANNPKTQHIRQVDSELLRKSPDNIWSFLLHASADVFIKVLGLSQPLGELAVVNGAATVSEAYDYKGSIYELRSLPQPIDRARYIPFVVSGTLGRYENRWAAEAVQYIKDSYIQPVLDINSGKVTQTRREQIRRKKIIISGMSKRPTGTIDEHGIVAAKSTIIIYDAKVGLGYLMSLINSTLMAHIYSVLFESLALSGGFLRFGPPQITRLPIRRIMFSTLLSRREACVEEGRQLYNQYLSDKDQAPVVRFVEEHLAPERNESDIIHDLLEFLAEEMVRLNDEKLKSQQEFLERLGIMLKLQPNKGGNAGLDALSGRSKLSDYAGDYEKDQPHLPFSDLLNILQKNRTRLGISLSDPIVIDRLRAVYTASLECILPLKEQLARTDQLIDQIIYRLYGLTFDEIAVVEGK